MTPDEEERSKRIAQLEARLGQRAPVGVMPPVAALALLLAGWMMWLQYADVAYAFSSRDPILLGVEGAYLFDRAVSNRYATMHGIPTLRGAYGVDGDQPFVVVGAQESPLLVKRKLLPTEAWKPGTTPPPPDQRPFMASGRLLSRADASKWAEPFAQHDAFGEQKPKWILIEGARPGADFAPMAWFGLLLAFAGVNVWLLVRGLSAALAARTSGAGSAAHPLDPQEPGEPRG